MPRKLYRKRKTNKKKKSINQVVKRAIKATFHPEVRYEGAGAVYSNSTGAPVVQIIDTMAITQGDADAGNRQGDKLTLLGADLKMAISGTANGFARILFIQWYGDDAVNAPTSAKIFHSLLTNDEYIAYTVWDNKTSDFNVLYDRAFPVDTAGDLSTIIKKRISMKYVKKVVQYKAGGIYGTNKLYAVLVVPNNTSISLYRRIKYYDL